MATAVLVLLADLRTFLGDPPTSDNTMLQSILDVVEQQFLADCNRRERPFLATGASARTEVRDGTGSPVLTLDYPISALTTVKLGRDASDPDETLDATDVDVLVYVAGKRTITRTDGGIWGSVGSPRYVRITYDTQADAPDVPKTAIKRLCGLIYRQLGSEGSKSESLSGYSRDLAVSDPIWQMAVRAEWEPRT